mmetsp:Transcript_12438/g.21777  ORF Transcript_12438/g.21777 Transcript_12438/m.21777 type:complete len:172 (+) Transcript_12438:2-517(+)
MQFRERLDDPSDIGDTSPESEMVDPFKPDNLQPVLPHPHPAKIAERLKTLSMKWAEEEQLMGNNIFYWNILSNEEMKAIASQAPITKEEISELGILGDKKLEEYGARIVKAIKLYVEKEDLERQLSRRPAKRRRTASEPPIIEIDDDDEDYDQGVDYSRIDLDAIAKQARN